MPKPAFEEDLSLILTISNCLVVTIQPDTGLGGLPMLRSTEDVDLCYHFLVRRGHRDHSAGRIQLHR